MLALTGAALAQDDDGLDTRPLGDPIPERVQQLEREWAEDTGLHDPADDAPDDGETEAERETDGEDAATEDARPPQPRVVEPAPPRKRESALGAGEKREALPPVLDGSAAKALSDPED